MYSSLSVMAPPAYKERFGGLRIMARLGIEPRLPEYILVLFQPTELPSLGKPILSGELMWIAPLFPLDSWTDCTSNTIVIKQVHMAFVVIIPI